MFTSRGIPVLTHFQPHHIGKAIESARFEGPIATEETAKTIFIINRPIAPRLVRGIDDMYANASPIKKNGSDASQIISRRLEFSVENKKLAKSSPALNLETPSDVPVNRMIPMYRQRKRRR